MSIAPDNAPLTAYIRMLLIGIGYLFPISAIWAAFDYWTLLFPGTNVEFVVTCLYQAGSVATVLMLSLGKRMDFGKRIYGGFIGQVSKAFFSWGIFAPMYPTSRYGSDLHVFLA